VPLQVLGRLRTLILLLFFLKNTSVELTLSLLGADSGEPGLAGPGPAFFAGQKR
jgi:hypothetical protein